MAAKINWHIDTEQNYVTVTLLAGQLNANMQHNRANGDTSTKIGVMTPQGILNRPVRLAT